MIRTSNETNYIRKKRKYYEVKSFRMESNKSDPGWDKKDENLNSKFSNNTFAKWSELIVFQLYTL